MNLKTTRYKELMEEKGLTLEDIAERTGLTHKSLYWIMDGNEASTQALDRMASALNVPAIEITAVKENWRNENCIDFLTGEEYATASFSQGRFKTVLRRLAEKYPDDVTLQGEGYGLLAAKVPVSWIRIARPKQVELTEGRKTELAERLRALRESGVNKPKSSEN